MTPDPVTLFGSAYGRYGSVLIVNLAKGRVGSDIANVLGGLITASLMNAAFSRYTQRPEQRRPYLLYVDEFHSFTTSAFATMLSEVRKYGLGVTLAHQYIQQADQAVFEAVMGNVGSALSFRVGALDAPLMVGQLEPVAEGDLTGLANYEAYARVMVKGERSGVFSVATRG